MGSEQGAWLEVAKALGPYVTGIVAIIGAFLSAWLTQRNWLKQFGRQQSVVLLTKRLEIAHELPLKLYAATQLGMRLVVNALLAETFAILKSEGREFSQETINRLKMEAVEAEKVLQEALGEVLKLQISVGAFFNDQIHEEVSQCVKASQQVIHSQTGASTFRGELKESIPPGITTDQARINVTRIINEHLQPINRDLGKRVGKLARQMVEYAQGNG